MNTAVKALKEILSKFPTNQSLEDIDDDEMTGRRYVTLRPNEQFRIRDIRRYRKALASATSRKLFTAK